MKTISPAAARKLVAEGAVFVDIREADEHARERIPGARSAPLSAGPPQVGKSGVVIFHCKTGSRTSVNASSLCAAAEGASCEAYMLEGGLQAWRAAGFPVSENRKAPLELMRQVQITAGGLALAGCILGFAVDPAFHAVSGFIGLGLLFAGVSGWCGMAKLLAVMPWNRAAA